MLGDADKRARLLRMVMKLYAGVAGSVEEFKEQIADLKAEVAAEHGGFADEDWSRSPRRRPAASGPLPAARLQPAPARTAVPRRRIAGLDLSFRKYFGLFLCKLIFIHILDKFFFIFIILSDKFDKFLFCCILLFLFLRKYLFLGQYLNLLLNLLIQILFFAVFFN